MKNLKIKIESLPLHFTLLGGFLTIYGLLNLVIWQSVILNSILFVVGLLLVTTHQALSINTKNKTYSEYYWVLGMKLSKFTEQYTEIISILCTSGAYSQEYGKYNRYQIRGTMYSGYIELKDQDAIFLGQNKSKAALVRKLEKISLQLGIKLTDRTTE